MSKLIFLLILHGVVHLVTGLSSDDLRLLQKVSDDQDSLRNALASVERRRRQFEAKPVSSHSFSFPNEGLQEMKREEEEQSYYLNQRSDEVNEPDDVPPVSSEMANKIMWISKESERKLRERDMDGIPINDQNTPYSVDNANRQQDYYQFFDKDMEFPVVGRHHSSNYDRKRQRSSLDKDIFKKQSLRKKKYLIPDIKDYSEENVFSPLNAISSSNEELSDDTRFDYQDNIKEMDTQGDFRELPVIKHRLSWKGAQFPDYNDDLYLRPLYAERRKKKGEAENPLSLPVDQTMIPSYEHSSSDDYNTVMASPSRMKNLEFDKSPKFHRAQEPSSDLQNYDKDISTKKKTEIKDLSELNSEPFIFPSNVNSTDLQSYHRLLAMSRKKKMDADDSTDISNEQNISFGTAPDDLQDYYLTMAMSQLKDIENYDLPTLNKYQELTPYIDSNKLQDYYQSMGMSRKKKLHKSLQKEKKDTKSTMDVNNIRDYYLPAMLPLKNNKNIHSSDSDETISEGIIDDTVKNLPEELRKRKIKKDIFGDKGRTIQLPDIYLSDKSSEEYDLSDKKKRLPFLVEEDHLDLKKRQDHLLMDDSDREGIVLGELKDIFKDDEERNRARKRQEGSEEQTSINSRLSGNDTDNLETQSLSHEQDEPRDKSEKDIPETHESHKEKNFDEWLRKEYIKTMAQALNTMKKKRSDDWVPIVSQDLDENSNEEMSKLKEFQERNKKKRSNAINKNNRDERDEYDIQEDEISKNDGASSEEIRQFSLAQEKIKNIEQSMINEALGVIQNDASETARSDVEKAIKKIEAAKELNEMGRSLKHFENTLGQIEEDEEEDKVEDSFINSEPRKRTSFPSQMRETVETEPLEKAKNAKQAENDLSLTPALIKAFYGNFLKTRKPLSGNNVAGDQCPPLELLTRDCSSLEKVISTGPVQRLLENSCNWHEVCYACGEVFGLNPNDCDAGFLEESAALCQDDVLCNSIARTVLVPLKQRRLFHKRSVPALCYREECIRDFLLTR
ncbi:dentin sialophosphoprotein-like [Limulus polyphemus]|uniref:Dentin sialophosphoprotein-like n=1 Tax=Limulus polyphemus TaxID=6850 RepID=A0ABM1BDM5_LIMPO|nr:dentin sialophosphoprotein-like [Limulus polyphemus]